MRSFGRVLLVCVALCLAASAQEIGKIFTVRHAEKESDADDSLLSSTGKARAECLGQTLKDAHIISALVTTRERTKQTAAAVVRDSQAKEQAFEPKDYPTIVAAAKAAAQSGNVLIVGHSNTLPALLAAFGAPQVTIANTSFDQLFVFDVSNPKALTTLHYCPNLPKDASGTGTMKP